MSRISTVALLEPEQRARVDNLLRRFGYGRIDQALAELASAGIALSRSALHRYAQRLREDDRVPVFGKGPVVVMVIDQRTDESTMVRTSLPAAAILSRLAALESPDHPAAPPHSAPA